MSRHAGPPRADDAPSVPEPTFAERARTLAYLGRTGTLATLSRRHPGHPFASVMPYALDDAGRPLFLISSMAMHTQNLEADPRASLLVTQPDWTGDPLAAGRLTLMGEARRVPQADAASAREGYLTRHERARYWADFEDFGLWRLEVANSLTVAVRRGRIDANFRRAALAECPRLGRNAQRGRPLPAHGV